MSEEKSIFGKPEFVTWGCFIIVYMEKGSKMLSYHIPLENEKSRQLWLIEKKMLGKQVGHRIYICGSWYELKRIWLERKLQGIEHKY